MKQVRRQCFVLTLAFLSFVSLLSISGCKKAQDTPEEAVKSLEQTVSEKAKVEFYVMSKCPFGVTVEDAIFPVLKNMGGDIDFTLDFIGSVNGDKLNSLHREPEVQGDKVQMCASKYASQNYMDFIACMNKNWRQIPDNWETCAKETNMPFDRIKACYEGQEGHDLLKASFERSKARRATGSPTIYIGGDLYRGGRSEKAFARAICEAFPKEKAKYCESIPPPVKVPITIISDERCKDCRTDMISKQMKNFFPGAEINVLDFNSEEGKKLYEQHKLTKLPILIFGSEIKQEESYARFERVLEPVGDQYIFSRYGRFDPTKEVCDNQKDDTGNNLIDCKDPDCTYSLNCRKEAKNKLEVFVMSQCPYGVRALDAMKEVLDNFKNNIDFEVHFIASEQGDGFQALHGQPEVDENIRELCAAKHYPKNNKYMDYIWCRNKNIRDSNWQTCTGGKTGIDTKVIEKCFNGEEGKKLLRDDIKIAEGLDVSASPTWFANNRHRFSGIDPETIKNNLCKHNKGLQGCENKLSGPDHKAPAGGACK